MQKPHHGRGKTRFEALKTVKGTGQRRVRRWKENYVSTLPTSSQQLARSEAVEYNPRRCCPKITDKMNDKLQQPFTEEEIFDALSQMCPTKAPGPYGSPAVFYQKHWKMVKTGVVDTCLHILNDQCTITPLNYTYIALIPKIIKPMKVTNFRPISLCNVIYRIIAKATANSLKHILHQVIFPTQSAFILNRLITDNIIVGYECLHKIRHSKGKKIAL